MSIGKQRAVARWSVKPKMMMMMRSIIAKTTSQFNTVGIEHLSGERPPLPADGNPATRPKPGAAPVIR